eukprot:c19308_g1_i1 orf=708-1658(+)
MHAKSDSEVTSLAPSSPPRSPRRPVYFVQSPSRDSHDGDSKISFQSTPLLSPIGSPLHPAFSRSRDSSQNLGNPSRGKHDLRKVLPHPRQDGSRSEKLRKPWATCNVIEEEPELPGSIKASQIYTGVLVFLSCVIFLILLISFFWLICKPQHPQLSVKNVVFHNFFMGEGTDLSGVPTKMVSLNCTVQLNFYNPSKYFTVHVNLVDISLDYSELGIATGQMKSFAQVKRSKKTVSVVVKAVKVPIYGAGDDLSGVYNAHTGIPLEMIATVHSQYFVVGKMVKPKFQSQATCNLVVALNNMALLSPLRSSCSYNPPN